MGFGIAESVPTHGRGWTGGLEMSLPPKFCVSMKAAQQPLPADASESPDLQILTAGDVSYLAASLQDSVLPLPAQRVQKEDAERCRKSVQKALGGC